MTSDQPVFDTEPDDVPQPESPVEVRRVQISAGPGVFAEATTEIHRGHGPLNVITLRSNRRLPSDGRRREIEEEEATRKNTVRRLQEEGKPVPEALNTPITVESRGYRGVDPSTWYNVRKYVKEGELFYQVDSERGGLQRVHSPSTELSELFDRLAEINKERSDNEFIKLTDDELERLK